MLHIRVVDMGIEIRVSRHAHHHFIFYGIPDKGEMPERAHDLFQRHQPYFVARSYLIHAIQRGIERHYTDHAPPVLFQIIQHIIFHVFKLHERVFRVKHHQGKQRHDVRSEDLLASFALARRQLARTHDADTAFVDVFAQRVITRRSVIVKTLYDGADAV